MAKSPLRLAISMSSHILQHLHTFVIGRQPVSLFVQGWEKNNPKVFHTGTHTARSVFTWLILLPQTRLTNHIQYTFHFVPAPGRIFMFQLHPIVTMGLLEKDAYR